VHIIYTCSPDRELELFTSIGSLFSSNTKFERITIFLVGTAPKSWKKITDKRIHVVEVDDIGIGFWMINKAHFCASEEEEIVFIDTDTLVLKPLNSIGSGVKGDIIGRTTSHYEQASWPKQAWQEYLDKYGASTYFPYLNTGLLGFRNSAHQRLAEPWKKITRELLVDENFPFGPRHHANQLAFSLAAGKLGISYGLLCANEHAYGWEDAPFDDSFVYHTGGPGFIDRAMSIHRKIKVLDKGPQEFRQPIERHYFQQQAKEGLLGLKNLGVRFTKDSVKRTLRISK